MRIQPWLKLFPPFLQLIRILTQVFWGGADGPTVILLWFLGAAVHLLRMTFLRWVSRVFDSRNRHIHQFFTFSPNRKSGNVKTEEFLISCYKTDQKRNLDQSIDRPYQSTLTFFEKTLTGAFHVQRVWTVEIKDWCTYTWRNIPQGSPFSSLSSRQVTRCGISRLIDWEFVFDHFCNFNSSSVFVFPLFVFGEKL